MNAVFFEKAKESLVTVRIVMVYVVCSWKESENRRVFKYSKDCLGPAVALNPKQRG